MVAPCDFEQKYNIKICSGDCSLGHTVVVELKGRFYIPFFTRRTRKSYVTEIEKLRMELITAEVNP